MGGKLKVREIKEEERKELERRRKSRTVEARVRMRAEMVLRKEEGANLAEIGEELGVDYETVSLWIHRFNAEGLEGLEEKEGRGRKRRYDEEARGEMIALARSRPQVEETGFSSWSLDRLQEVLQREKGIGVSRAQLARILEAEGLKWYQERTYFTERPDPQFAEKRGR
jgi:transposase